MKVVGKSLLIGAKALTPGFRKHAGENIAHLMEREAASKGLALCSRVRVVEEIPLRYVHLGEVDEDGEPVKTLVSCTADQAEVVQLNYEAHALPRAEVWLPPTSPNT